MNKGERFFDQELSELKGFILEMGGYVESAIGKALGALIHHDLGLCQTVYEIENKINVCHIKVDDYCLKLFARQQPVASDLRMMLAITKINTDLERMGDQAVNIAKNVEFYLKSKPHSSTGELQEMATQVQSMVKMSLDCFVNSNTTLAWEVIKLDDRIDELKNRIFQDQLKIMKQESSMIDESVDLILIARNLERLGDHATNIAEDVIFITSGQDIRHGGRKA